MVSKGIEITVGGEMRDGKGERGELTSLLVGEE